MNPGEIIAIILTVLIIGGAVAYIVKAKHEGRHCIGCPHSAACPSKSCSGNCSSCSSCSSCHSAKDVSDNTDAASDK